MRAIFSLAILITLSALSLAQRMEPNSYLNRRVSNPAGLINQLRNDPVVRDRFMRHYSMTEQELVEYFSSFRMGKLERSGTYTVYNAPATGVLRVRARNLKKGTPVFLDASGTPVMLVSCGNPLEMPVPGAEITPPVSAEVEAIPPTYEPTMETMTPTEVYPPDVSPVPAEVVPAPNPIPEVSRGGSSFPFLLALPLLAFVGGGGGDNPPIPEPATMVVLGAGAVYVISRRRRKNS